MNPQGNEWNLLYNKHEDHSADKGFTSMPHCNLVHNFIPMPQAIEKKEVHFVTLMDICHLKNAELEPKLQMYKGRVVLQGTL